VQFGEQATDITQGRNPDGSTSIQALPRPTPRMSNNTAANRSPVITNPGTRSLIRVRC
jgi:hypothetical protein